MKTLYTATLTKVNGTFNSALTGNVITGECWRAYVTGTEGYTNTLHFVGKNVPRCEIVKELNKWYGNVTVN